METERQLLEAIHSGDRAALRRLYDRYAGYAMAVALRYTPKPDLARDVLQEGFVRILTAIPRFRFHGEGSLKNWVARIVSNCAIDSLRQNQHILFTDDLPDAPDPDEDPSALYLAPTTVFPAHSVPAPSVPAPSAHSLAPSALSLAPTHLQPPTPDTPPAGSAAPMSIPSSSVAGDCQSPVSEPSLSDLSPDTLMHLIARLPDNYRTVLNLFVFERYSHRDIARLLSIKESTSSSLLFRARKALARLINQHLNTHAL